MFEGGSIWDKFSANRRRAKDFDIENFADPNPNPEDALIARESAGLEEEEKEDVALLADSDGARRNESPQRDPFETQNYAWEDPLPTHEYERIARARAALPNESEPEEPEARKQKFKAEKTRTYSKQGREEKGKHNKGGDTIRGGTV